MAEQESLIDISTKPERRFFTVDDEKHYLKSPAELSISARHGAYVKAQTLEASLHALAKKTSEATQEEERNLVEGIDTLLRSVVYGDIDKLAALTDTQKLLVVRSFFEQQKEATSQDSSPASNGSTGDASPTG